MAKLNFHQQRTNGDIKITFSCDENGFSPANLLVRKLFYFMLDITRNELQSFEVEYNDQKLVDELGLGGATHDLQRLGAAKENTQEKKKGEIVYSRTFISDLTADRFEYFRSLVFLDQFISFRFFDLEKEVIQVTSGKYLVFFVNEDNTKRFFEKLNQDKIPYQVSN